MSFPSLPEELQLTILEACNDSTLASLCCTSRDIYDKALPLLWGHLDFKDPEVRPGPQWRWLITCDNLIRKDRERWSRLSPLVCSLKLVKALGPYIPNLTDPMWYDPLGFFVEHFDPDPYGSCRNVYDIISHFVNLETISLFVRDCWGPEADQPMIASGKVLEDSLPKLRNVKLGGQIPGYVLKAFCSGPETIQELSLINTIGTPRQAEGPPPVLLLEPIAHRFTSLTYLHLSKLASVSDDDDYLTNIRWQWDLDEEHSLLQDWATLLDQVNKTLVTLKLENRYPAWGRTELHEMLDETDDKEALLRQYGIGSSDRCKAVLFPVIAKYAWPALRHVKLMGIHTQDGRGGPASPFESMKPLVEVEDLPGSFVAVDDQITPAHVSPPPELFGTYRDCIDPEDEE